MDMKTRRTVTNFIFIIFTAFFFAGCALQFSVGDETRSPGPGLIKIEGVYECSSPDYLGLTKITRKDQAYHMEWQIKKQVYFGVGIRDGNILSSSFVNAKGAYGIVVYRILPGPKLVGKYTSFPGDGLIKTETLTLKGDFAPPDEESLQI
jgi:hypothetical protein